ncbi:MAG: ribonuclease P protein component [Pedosphaera sp.]|nr:ribonuclease P protein component [Pedosphaera sp.]
MPASAPLTLSRSQRIKQGRDFARLKSKGLRVVHGCLIVNWLELPADRPSRMAVITTRKLGNAVVRSRCRRLLRECFRLHQHDLREPAELILVARASLTGKDFAGVEKDYLTALRQGKLLKTTA